MNELFEFFWHGPFSQWHKCAFVVNGVSYNCAEQFMMAQKAILFGDSDTLKEIMDTDNPKTQKSLGRKVKDFDPLRWDRLKLSVVYIGNYAKFTQNPSLKVALMSTGEKTMVEASPYDKVWGIGLDASSPDALDRNTWHGENYLGRALDAVKVRIRAEMMEEDLKNSFMKTVF